MKRMSEPAANYKTEALEYCLWTRLDMSTFL